MYNKAERTKHEEKIVSKFSDSGVRYPMIMRDEDGEFVIVERTLVQLKNDRIMHPRDPLKMAWDAVLGMIIIYRYIPTLTIPFTIITITIVLSISNCIILSFFYHKYTLTTLTFTFHLYPTSIINTISICMVPMQTAFTDSFLALAAYGNLEIFDYCIDCLFFIDIVLNFNTG